MFWRIGNEKSVNIFTEKWVPSMHEAVGAALSPWEHDLTVSGLIKDGDWDETLINNSFNTYVAGEILKIPLTAVESEDVQFWRFDTKKRYFVRDGCILQRGFFDPPASQSVFPYERWWAFLWRLSLPQRLDSTCHALFFCPAINHWWSKSNFVSQFKVAKRASTMELFLWMQTQLSKTEFEEFAILAWAVWKEKQNFLHGDRSKPLMAQIT
ncbi:uncharacterized protein [Henckelia pumila]|uniref:uncharacterized protein n=1 Tax=Henckelia pumila TaxID=405737 RepID=UPI003C6DF9AA